MAIPFSVAVEGAAGNLVPTDYRADLLELTMGRSQVVPAIPTDSKYFMERLDDSFPITISGMYAGETSELEIKNYTSPEVSAAPLVAAEMTAWTASTDRLIENSVVAIVSMFQREALKAFVNLLDAWILGGTIAGSTTPAGWGGGTHSGDLTTAAVAAGNVYNGVTYTSLYLLLSAMVNDVIDANDVIEEDSTVWLVRRGSKQAIREAQDPDGQYMFATNPESDDGSVGNLLGYRVYFVDNLKYPTDVDLYLVDMSKILFGVKGDGIGYDETQYTSYPDAGTGSLVPAWLRNETVYKWHQMYAFTVFYDEGVALASGIELATS